MLWRGRRRTRPPGDNSATGAREEEDISPRGGSWTSWAWPWAALVSPLPCRFSKGTAFSYAPQGQPNPFNSALQRRRTSKATMPSRKKERGRQNRAKKEATRTANQRSQWETIILRNISATSSGDATSSFCEHMLAVPPRIPQEGTAVSFMNCIAGEGFFDKATRFPSGSLKCCIRLVARFRSL